MHARAQTHTMYAKANKHENEINTLPIQNRFVRMIAMTAIAAAAVAKRGRRLVFSVMVFTMKSTTTTSTHRQIRIDEMESWMN